MGLTPWSEGEPILRAEWARYVESDPDDRGSALAFDRRMADMLGGSRNRITQKRNKLGLILPKGGAQRKAAPTEAEADRYGKVHDAIANALRPYVVADGSIYFPIEGRMFPIPLDVWESICEMYSRRGGNLTGTEIALKVGIDESVLRTCLRLGAHYKASLPFPEHVLIEEPEEALVARSLAAKKRAVASEIDRQFNATVYREWREMRVKLEDEGRWIEKVREIAEAMPAPAVKVVRVGEPADGPDYTAVVVTTDEHVGLLVHGKETLGANYETDLALERLRWHAEATVSWLASQPGRCRRIVRAHLGDLFHTRDGRTEHGTPLHQDTRSQRVWTETAHALREGIEMYRQITPDLRYMFVPGNHDGKTMTHQLMLLLNWKYEGVEGVEIPVHPARYAAFREGRALHVLDHGYGISALGWKAKATAEVTARAAGGELFHGAEAIYTYIGDKHNRAIESLGDHHQIIRFEALTEPDDYATDLRFRHRPVARVLVLNGEGMIETERVLYPPREVKRALALALAPVARARRTRSR